MPLPDIPLRRNDGSEENLTAYQGRVLLIVNTASDCGFTPQYTALQSLHERYSAAGLSVLAFPCNQFAHQESGDDAQIRAFCDLRFKVRFPLFAKTEVNGDHTHPLFVWLKEIAPGLLGSRAIKWNFTKFLVSRDATQVRRFAPQTAPESLAALIETWLQAS